MEIVGMKYNYVKNLGNGCSSSLSVEATIGKEDNALDAFKTLEAFVKGNLENRAVSIQVQEALELVKEPKKQEAIKPQITEEVNNGTNNEETSSKESSEASEKSSSETSEESSKEIASEKVASKEKVKRTPKPKTKFVAYDRNNQNHKMDFSQLLDGLFKGWKADASMVTRAKLVSTQLEGKDMYDLEGKILPEFVELAQKGMSEQAPIKA